MNTSSPCLRSLNDIERIKDCLQYISNNLYQQTPEERLVTCSFIQKIELLQKGCPVEETDWDYISLGILIKQLVKNN